MRFSLWWTKKSKSKSKSKSSRRHRRERPFRVHGQDYHGHRDRDVEATREYYSRGERKHHRHRHHGKDYITALPIEVQHNIFSNLDPYASTTAGLSSRKLYPVHRSKHRKTSLFETSPDYPLPMVFTLQRELPRGKVLNWSDERLIEREHLKEKDARRREKDRVYWERRSGEFGALPQDWKGYRDYDRDHYERSSRRR